MLRARRILFPTDFSPTSDAGLDLVCDWARVLESEVHLLHVLQSLPSDLYPASVGASDAALASSSLMQLAAGEMAKRRRRATYHAVAVTCTTTPGLAAAPEILDYAEANDVDLIAMSTHGRRGVRRLLLGSVAEEVVQRSSCPVLTIAAGSRSSHTPWPQRILVAVDLSEHSSAVVAHGKELAALFRADLQLLHIVVRPALPAFYGGAGLPLVFDSPLLEREVQGALETLYQRAGGPAGPSSVHVEHGVAAKQIVRHAAVNSSELIIVASHGLTGVSHLLMGSVSERVVREAPCPVLAIKSFGKSLTAKTALPAPVASPGANGADRRSRPHQAC